MKGKVRSFFITPVARGENFVALASLLLVFLLPLAALFCRALSLPGLPDSNSIVVHCTLIFACAGAAIATRERRQLGLNSDFRTRGLPGALLGALQAALTSAILWSLFCISVSMVFQIFDPEARLAALPLWVFAAFIPLSFGLMALRSSARDYRGHPVAVVLGFLIAVIASSSAIAMICAGFIPEAPQWFIASADLWFASAEKALWPLAMLLAVSPLLGVPLFVAVSGLAYLAFSASGGTLEAVPYGFYAALTGETVPAIPLFILAGVIMVESGAGKRLFTFFQSLFSPIRGGPALAAACLWAFFTAFTGASGLALLAFGTSIALVLTGWGWSEARSQGFLTASGSLGLLLPPSIAVIVYSSVSEVPVLSLSIGGLLPGLLLLAAMGGIGAWLDRGRDRPAFSRNEVLRNLRGALGELLLPLIVIACYASGLLSLVETAALTALLAIILEVFIHGDPCLRRLPASALKSIPVTGGILSVLAASRAFSDFLVDQQVPDLFASWSAAHISSPFLFLLLLNLALLVAGCLMDLYSAIIIAAPLVIPAAALFGVNPVHLGIIFLTNLSLGLLTPPVGTHLSIASTCFKKPLVKGLQSVIPFLLVQLVALLAVTYFPFLTTVFFKG